MAGSTRRTHVIPFWVLVVVMCVVFFGGALFVLLVQQRGERTQAKVSDCVHRRIGKSVTDYCTGTWVAGGSLIEGGHVVRGTIDGANSGDEGKTIDVRLSGGRAYTTSRRLPIIIFAIGAAFLVFGGIEVRKQRRARPAG